MTHLFILIEEPSMENVLQTILPKIVDTEQVTWDIYPHYGKQNMLKQLPKKLKAYNNFITSDQRILIIVDQDQENCYDLKRRILEWCDMENLRDKTLVRVVVVALESWFLGDIEALETAFPKLKKQRMGNSASYRIAENRPRPAEDLERELKASGYDKGYLKLAHSADIAQHMNIETNRATSFQVTISGIKKLVEQSYGSTNTDDSSAI